MFTLARCQGALPEGATTPKRPIVARDRGQPWTMEPLGHNIKPFFTPAALPHLGHHPLKLV